MNQPKIKLSHLFLLTILTIFASCASSTKKKNHSVYSASTSASHSSALSTIDHFYKDYLAQNGSNDQPDLPFSKTFTDLLLVNRKICKEKAGTDICGWGTDGDVYLNSQEVDPKLTFENSGYQSSETSDGMIEVKFNVYPSLKSDNKYYDKKILFMMIKENGKWVVDNMKFGNDFARKQIQNEIDSYKK